MSDTFTFEVDLIEKELVEVNLNVVDIIHEEGTGSTGTADLSDLVYNESPTQLSARSFQTANNFQPSSLVVYVNGIKEGTVVIDGSNQFSLDFDIITGDEIEINYIKS